MHYAFETISVTSVSKSIAWQRLAINETLPSVSSRKHVPR